MIQVVAALIERNGQILICQRLPSQAHALQWEFPGGKVELGETPGQALERELEEELDIYDAEGSEIARYEYTYPGKNPIELIFFRVTGFSGEPRNLIFHEMTWAAPRELGSYDFLEGDLEFIRSLS